MCNITSTGSNKHWIGPYAILDGLDCGIFCDVESVAFKRRSKKNRLMLKPAIAGFKRQKTSHLASAALNKQLKQQQCHDWLGTSVIANIYAGTSCIVVNLLRPYLQRVLIVAASPCCIGSIEKPILKHPFACRKIHSSISFISQVGCVQFLRLVIPMYPTLS